MDFKKFTSLISKLSQTTAGGTTAQLKLAPTIRKLISPNFIKNSQPRRAAVLALFYPNAQNETQFLLTKRASYKGVHSAQISFPGGKFDPSDSSLQQAALRETYEEIGVPQNQIQVFKEMTNVFIPPSNFLVTPFLGCSNQALQFTKNHEVEELIQVDLKDLLDETSITSTILSTSYAHKLEVPCFELNSYIVWGATAMMLNEIRELFKKL